MIFLFTDFGLHGPYVGQMHAVLARHVSAAPRVIDLMHDAPVFRPVAAGHLLAALSGDMPAASVCVGVVDPGVGTARRPVVVEADGRWFVGPDNGLFETIAARAGSAHWWYITREPDRASATFHGRDLFAPVAAALGRGEPVPGEAIDAPHDTGAGDDLARVIYVDGYGNAMTGLRAGDHEERALAVGGRTLPRGTTFADAAPGDLLWLVNSIGLVEIVANQASAADMLGLAPDVPVEWAGR